MEQIVEKQACIKAVLRTFLSTDRAIEFVSCEAESIIGYVDLGCSVVEGQKYGLGRENSAQETRNWLTSHLSGFVEILEIRERNTNSNAKSGQFSVV